VCFGILAGRAEQRIPAREGIRDIRIGVPRNFFFDRIDLEVALAVRTAVQTAAALGARVVEVDVPDMDAANVAGRVIQLAEASAVLLPYANRRADLGADVLALLDQGRLVAATDYVDAQRLRRLMARELSRIWSQVDCLFTPATPIPAPKIGEMLVSFGDVSEDVRVAATRLTRPFSLFGLPALVIPCGLTKRGLPIGLQIAGAPQQEDLLLRIGAAIEDATAFSAKPAS
jgi:aspartyl-tRNA(Asn)/glutamyl-tRNA(Gln) amidotransferase subunit A